VTEVEAPQVYLDTPAVDDAALVQQIFDVVPGEVTLWAPIRDAAGTVVGSGLEFGDYGTHELKGVPGRWPVMRLLR